MRIVVKVGTSTLAHSTGRLNIRHTEDLVKVLSDIDGLYTANPHTHPDAKLIPVVERITPEVLALADGAGSALGTGGMSTKLRAAQMVTAEGADMVIANGSHPELLYDIADGRPAGTRFAGRKEG